MTDIPTTLPARFRKGDDLDLLREQAFEVAITGPVTALGQRAGDAKTKKSLKKLNVLTLVTYLAPGDVSGSELCNFRTKGCSEVCLFSAGQGRFSSVKIGRLRKTYQFLFRREEYMTRLSHEINLLDKYAERKGFSPAVRLNATSDIPWENIPVSGEKNIFLAHPNMQFYDYTKHYDRLEANEGYENYHLTFSWAETKANQAASMKALENGFNVAIVFDQLPDAYKGYRVIDGDETDVRFWDVHDDAVFVGLIPKGEAKKDFSTGFVVRLAQSA